MLTSIKASATLDTDPAIVRLLRDAGELGLRGGAKGFAEPLPPPPQLDKMALRLTITIYLKIDRDLSICTQAP
jgi:hypothetical protein